MSWMSSINKIFDLFSQESEGDSEEEKKQEQILVDFRNHPVYSVLMFKKMILNHIHNRKMIIVLMKQSDPKLNEENILKMGDSICFNKALDYLASLDLNNELVNKSFKEQADKDLLFTVNKAIEYFENLENYEQCAFLKQVQNKVKENLN
jgi:hypothetical protein